MVSGSPPDQTTNGGLIEMYPNMELIQGVPEDLGLQYFDKEQRNLLIIDDCEHLAKRHEGLSELICCGVHHGYTEDLDH